MPRRLGRFEMPKRIAKDEAEATPTYAKFIAEPFEAGYGRTIGNSLRRVLLSSLEGAAISSVRIEGALHEFCSLPGVVEDVTDIILNLKKVLLKAYSREPRKVKINVKGPGEVTAKDIQTDGTIEVLNPDHHICTLDKRRQVRGRARSAHRPRLLPRGLEQEGRPGNRPDSDRLPLLPGHAAWPMRWRTPAWAAAPTTTSCCSKSGPTAA
jgi:hypothetical protein